MWNHLHGFAFVITGSFLSDDIRIDAPARNRRVLGQFLIDEALIVTQIQIRFATVAGNKHLTVLVGAHCTRIHIEIRIKLLHKYRIAVILEQSTHAACADAFADTGNDATGNKNKFCHAPPPALLLLRSLFLILCGQGFVFSAFFGLVPILSFLVLLTIQGFLFFQPCRFFSQLKNANTLINLRHM